MADFKVTTETHPDGHIIYALTRGQTTAARVIPSLGANCVYLALPPAAGKKAVAVIDDLGLIPELIKNPFRYGIPILSPWASGIPEGKFTYQGKAVNLNAPGDTKSAHHGFVFNAPWKVTNQEASDKAASLTCAVDSAKCSGYGETFPYPFTLEMTWTLEESGFTIGSRVINTGDASLPLGYGLHPYFTVPVGRTGEAGATTLAVDIERQWDLMAILKAGPGKEAPKEVFLKEPTFVPDNRPIAGVSFNHVYQAKHDAGGRTYARITNPTSGLRVSISGDKSISTWVIFNPKDRAVISLEPWTHTPNAINLQEAGIKDSGLINLAPGETWQSDVRITLDKA